MNEYGYVQGIAHSYQRDAYGDLISPGAFEKSIRMNGGQVLIRGAEMHKTGAVIGLTTLLEEHTRGMPGLYFEGFLDLGIPEAREEWDRIKSLQMAGSPLGVSIGATADRDGYKDSPQGRYDVREADVFELLLTLTPGGPGTWCAIMERPPVWREKGLRESIVDKLQNTREKFAYMPTNSWLKCSSPEYLAEYVKTAEWEQRQKEGWRISQGSDSFMISNFEDRGS